MECHLYKILWNTKFRWNSHQLQHSRFDLLHWYHFCLKNTTYHCEPFIVCPFFYCYPFWDQMALAIPTLPLFKLWETYATLARRQTLTQQDDRAMKSQINIHNMFQLTLLLYFSLWQRWKWRDKWDNLKYHLPTQTAIFLKWISEIWAEGQVRTTNYKLTVGPRWTVAQSGGVSQSRTCQFEEMVKQINLQSKTSKSESAQSDRQASCCIASCCFFSIP